MKVKIIVVLGLLVCAGAVFLYMKKESARPEQFQGRERKSLSIREHTFDVVISKTEAEFTQGLSSTHQIDENEGMLFIFPTPGKYNFWMKDMNYPIDMLWINKNNKIIFIQKNATPESYPNSFGPTDDQTLMVLEITAGLSDKLGITDTDSIVIK